MSRVGIKHQRKYERTCTWCGTEFLAAHPRAAVCSENCRKRASAERNRPACPECGGPMGTAARRRGDRHCLACRRKEEAQRADQFVQWWANGETLAQIGERVGWTVNCVFVTIDRYRQQGYDFPYRRTAEARERMRVARWGEAA